MTRTMLFTSEPVRVEPAMELPVDAARAAQRLAEALRFQTVSYRNTSRVDQAAFGAFRGFIEETFPKIHSSFRRETVHDGSLLYMWPGRESTRKPIVLMAHQDVVPIAEDTADDWIHPPFGGTIADGYIWGRGALDDKSSLMGILEAVEMLLDEGFTPARTVYLFSGHDEETGGRGAAAAVDLLKSRGVKPEYVLDEGGAIVVGAVPGLPGPVAAVGVSEKGYLTLELTVECEGGHSSTPPANTAIGILGKAIANLEANPLPADMTYASQFFEHVGPEMAFLERAVFANLWLTRPLVQRVLSASPSTNAILRTTTAATMFNAGVKENVLPSSALAVVNFRILPGESPATVIEHVKDAIADERVSIVPRGNPHDPSPVSDIRAESYQMLRKTILQVADSEDMVVAPYLTLAATDARHFCAICPNVYRFLPFAVEAEELKGIHGVNERISVRNQARMVHFYYQVLRNSEML